MATLDRLGLALTVRPCVDAAAVRTLAGPLAAGYDAAIWGERTFDGILERLLAYRSRDILAVQVGADIRGVFAFLPFPEAGTDALETFLYLDPAARRRGIARALLHNAALAASRARLELWSDVALTNDASLALHAAAFPGLPTVDRISPRAYLTRSWRLDQADPAALDQQDRWLREDLHIALARTARAMSTPVRLAH
jgi:GNAT superfamily N-acetyltransferase